MNARDETKVILKCDALGVESQAFTFSHAERLLAMRDNGGWELNDKQFTYSKEDGLRRRKNKKGAPKSE